MPIAAHRILYVSQALSASPPSSHTPAAVVATIVAMAVVGLIVFSLAAITVVRVLRLAARGQVSIRPVRRSSACRTLGQDGLAGRAPSTWAASLDGPGVGGFDTANDASTWCDNGMGAEMPPACGVENP